MADQRATPDRATPDRVASYGRGGAGNMGKEDPATHITPKDLVTPTLKSEHYTTGRGGSGNMAKNDPARPEVARAAQDVEAPAHREPDGPHHYGRGGAANIAKMEEEKRAARVAAGTEKDKKPSGEKKRASGEMKERKSEEVRREDGRAEKGIVDKGKEFLQKLGGKK
ncbi:hypothetical protein DPSP01_002161 [Paraphaeosphaeria sporulosa]|uniref:Uncharacterized protein n=1 Tax=Paraphaeosphaeria sporulosa TaxID=1460663 RepID=A0A177C1K3_9PLEO|nr:uncharacterized protein CC84DRAFT_1168751 [Paraphaeosphaeria sporulosa]OAG00712.1 hypothetical protein CC84DRAFT_1168751 [Paraphaeosphaeria sporulosa]